MIPGLVQQDIPGHLHLEDKSAKLLSLFLPAMGYGTCLRPDNLFQFMSPKLLKKKKKKNDDIHTKVSKLFNRGRTL